MKTQQSKLKNVQNGGAAALSVVLVVSSIILAISIAGVIISTLVVNSSFSERLASEALLAARAGAQDGILRIVRAKGCPGSCPSYSLDLTSGRTANVQITRSGPLPGVTPTFPCNAADNICVISDGVAGARKRMVAGIVIDSTTGEVRVQLFREVPL